MAVKAREKLESKPISMITMVIIFAVILGYTFFYNRLIVTMDNYELKTIIGIVALTIMIIGFVLSIRFISTSYDMTLTHERFKIERKIFFWKKEVANITLKEIKKIIPLEEAEKVNGTTRNFTLGKNQGNKKYALIFKRQGKICCAKLQLSRNFYEKFRKEVEK
jgi:hypothetical protein